MPLESVTYISDLVATNPVNATDQVAQGDDHIRNIKAALLATFPNITGAVTATHTELNLLDGVTATTAELNILDGVTLTASQINDAARLSVSNTFTAQEIRHSNSAPSQWMIDTNATADNQKWRISSTGVAWVLGAVNDAENSSVTALQFDRSGTTLTGVVLGQTGATLTLNGATLTLNGTLTTGNTSASEVGFKGTPQNAQNGDYTLVLTDCGKTIYKASGGAGETITIPANTSVAFPVGTIVRIVNNGGGTLTVAITSDTLTLAGAGTTGSRTLSDDGVAVIEKVATTEWFISGAGVT